MKICPPQSTDQDYTLAKEALESVERLTLPDYQTPSKPYYERKLGEVTTGFLAEPLTHVTNKTQEEAIKQKAEPFLTSEGRISTKIPDFSIPLPVDAEDLENRLKVLGHAT